MEGRQVKDHRAWEQQSGEFLPGLFFCLRYTRFRGKEASNPDRTTGTETKKKKKRKSPIKACFSSRKMKKRASRKTGNLMTIAVLQPNTIEKLCSPQTHTSRGWVENVDLKPHDGLMGCPHIHTGVVISEKVKEGARTLISAGCWPGAPPSRGQWRTRGEPAFPSPMDRMRHPSPFPMGWYWKEAQ